MQSSVGIVGHFHLPLHELSPSSHELATQLKALDSSKILKEFSPIQDTSFHSKNIKKIELAYYRLTRRIPKELEMDKKLDALAYKEMRVDLLLVALSQRNWKHSIFHDPEYPYIALLAVREGKLSAFEFSTLMFYWTICIHHIRLKSEIEVVPLFHDGEINQEAYKLIKLTMSPTPFLNPKIRLNDKPYLSKTDLIDLWKIMKTAPESEKQFFLIPFKKSSPMTVSEAIQKTGINVFFQVDLPFAVHKRIVPSLTLMQTYLNVKFDEKARQINPTIGLSSLRDIAANGCFGERDLAIPFPYIFIPDEADNHPAPGVDFSYHDFYHSIMSSGVPIGHAHALIRSAYCVRLGLNNFDPQSIDYSSKLIDMEASPYRIELDYMKGEKTRTLEDSFWAELIQKSFPVDKEVNKRDKIFEPISHILSDCLLNSSDWMIEFGICVDLEKIKKIVLDYLLYKSASDFIETWNKLIGHFKLAQKVQALLMENRLGKVTADLIYLDEQIQNHFFAGITDKECLLKIFSILNKRKKLNLSAVKLLEDVHMEKIAISMKHIEELNLTGCTALTGNALALLEQLPRLEILHLSGCNQLLDHLHSLPSSLDNLSLVGMRQVFAKQISHLINSCPKLTVLDLSRCKVLEPGVFEILRDHPSLVEIHLNQCKNVTIEQLRTVIQNLRLNKIWIRNCPQFNKKIASKLEKERHACKSLVIEKDSWNFLSFEI